MAWADDVVTLHIKQAEVRRGRTEVLDTKRTVIDLIAYHQYREALLVSLELESYEHQLNTMQVILDRWRKQLGL